MTAWNQQSVKAIKEAEVRAVMRPHCGRPEGTQEGVWILT